MRKTRRKLSSVGVHELSPTEWMAFGTVIVALLAVDLFVHRGERLRSRRSAAMWTIIWIAAGLGFCVFVLLRFGSIAAREYLGAYLIEKSLSLDNLFVFLVIFQTLGVPRDHQRTVLVWGIFGALIFRAIFIFLGAAAIRRWDWVEIVFGAVLLVTAYRVFRDDPAKKEESKLARWLTTHLPFTVDMTGGKFFCRMDGRIKATPLFLAIVTVELTDIVFAIDSVPAAFAISHSEFILYTSNAFAILGLRALYILMADLIGQLRYLHYGLAAVLAFAGVKLVTNRWYHVGPLTSVAVIVTIVGLAVLASLWSSRRRRAAGEGVEAKAPT